MYKFLANTVILGKEIIFLTECHSTNEEAMSRLKRREIAEGSIVITDNQTKGKGQRGNTWISEPGKNLTFSVVLRPGFLQPSEQFWLNMAVSNAILETLSDYVSGILVKWPNDLVHDQAGKLGGILIENIIQVSAIESSVVGIGLNINQVDFPMEKVCSMASLAGQEFDRWELLRALVKNLETSFLLLKKGNRKTVKSTYLSNMYRLSEWAHYQDGEKFEGRILGIDEDGQLRIERRDGRIKHYSYKEVAFL